MGRTLPSIGQVFQFEEGQLQKFRRAMRKEDQTALDELFDDVQYHLAPVAYAGSATPFELFLLAMLLEQHKQIKRLRSLIGDDPGTPQ
jgi:hypothetical protein